MTVLTNPKVTTMTKPEARAAGEVGGKTIAMTSASPTITPMEERKSAVTRLAQKLYKIKKTMRRFY
jgi:hypothetical protein